MGDVWLSLTEIVLVNLVLSGDNALLIAMATARLPSHQRRMAMGAGIAAAMLLRLVLTGVAAELMLLPFLRTLGALLLIVIAVSLIQQGPSAEEAPAVEGTDRSGWLSAIGTILLADVTMSLDNVAALAGMAEGNWGLLIGGLLISMVFMLAASAGISSLLERFPILLTAGAGILAWTAGRILAEDEGFSHVAGQHVWIALLLLGGIAIGIKRCKKPSC